MALHHEIHYITDSEEQKTATHNNTRAKRGRLCDSKINQDIVFLYSYTLYNLSADRLSVDRVSADNLSVDNLYPLIKKFLL